MFFRILKKDLKNRKTMNVIMLIFVILSSMFASAAINNIYAVNGGVEHFMKISDVPDVMISTSKDVDEEKIIEEIKSIEGINQVDIEHIKSYVQPENFTFKGKKLTNSVNPGVFISEKEYPTKLFDENNKVIEDVKPGTFYCSNPFIKDLDVEIGDTFTLTLGNTKMDLTYAGIMKGYTISDDTAELLLDESDYKTLSAEPISDIFSETIFNVRTDNPQKVINKYQKNDTLTTHTPESYKDNYTYQLISAFFLMASTIILMITSFIILKFIISFTIDNEFREIGIMKAIGIKARDIRVLYLFKYVVIAILGSIIGFILSIPFGSFMLNSISTSIVFVSSNLYVLGIITSVLVIFITLLLCYRCTKKIKKIYPLDAIRDGQTGERYKKKNLLHLKSSKLNTTTFLSVNDILCAPKRFIIICIILALMLLSVTLFSAASSTLGSAEMFKACFVPKGADVFILDINALSPLFTEEKGYESIIKKANKICKDNSIPATCIISYGAGCNIITDDKKINIEAASIYGGDNCDLEYIRGEAPKATDEIAVTEKVLKRSGLSIGDKITLNINEKTESFIITGTFSSFNVSGLIALLPENYYLTPKSINLSNGIIFSFTDNPDKKTADNYFKKIKKAYDNSDKVHNAEEYLSDSTGMEPIFNTMRNMMMIVMIIVTSLIIILMERSFITKEKGEIALMKALGVSNISIRLQHVLRFTITSIIGAILSSIILLLSARSLITMGSNMFGDVHNLNTIYNPLDVFILSPLLLIAISIIVSFITTGYIKHIQASDTACIE